MSYHEEKSSAEIAALGKAHGFEKEALQAISNGDTVEQFRNWMLRKLESQQGRNQISGTSSGELVGLSQREIEGYSFLKALRGQMTGDYRECGLEKEVSDTMHKAKNSGKEDYRGLAIPLDVLFHRDLTVGSNSGGGYTVATDLLAGSFIDLLNNAMQIHNLGATTLSGLVGDVAVPKNSTGATAYWVAEGSDVTESAPAFSQVTLSPNTVGAMTDLTRKLILQSSIDVEHFVRRHLAERLALAIDLAAINGTGANDQPLGILGTTGIGSVVGGANGAAPTNEHAIDLETAIAVDNADIGSLGYLTNAKVRGKLKKSHTNSTYGEIPVWSGGKLNDNKALVSNQVPCDLTKGSASGVCSAMIYGNWADLLIGMWGGLDLVVDKSTHSASGGVRIVCFQDVDVAVRNPESFAAMVDILTT